MTYNSMDRLACTKRRIYPMSLYLKYGREYWNHPTAKRPRKLLRRSKEEESVNSRPVKSVSPTAMQALRAQDFRQLAANQNSPRRELYTPQKLRISKRSAVVLYSPVRLPQFHETYHLRQSNREKKPNPLYLMMIKPKKVKDDRPDFSELPIEGKFERLNELLGDPIMYADTHTVTK